ncbi:MAG TPA: hypothetical protein VMH39_02800, partial [Gemmatimonadaceae bacterium]|nr:hypothetical protein [Gemmatimonadaceae bacterium]
MTHEGHGAPGATVDVSPDVGIASPRTPSTGMAPSIPVSASASGKVQTTPSQPPAASAHRPVKTNLLGQRG